ncbi:MAG: Filamentation induced by cAMP protein Fic [Candidatus Roizmanbacteria bacterium GW2011_GWA2_35_19]|uniref:Filamentation induced by cAMP protein Fic n=2 Tax=Candidatus Roizmaniibacteriota TaxID=1752723 RepID=A0A0G0EYF1_9BACT|nr:MAG: Filamentation induced by cAMP protein Fic [Candidatus Roizmanbacteria bacterium GW2011_GWC2_35_12]KKP72147.1 MAG: Filamentation induced by cAMP protein Fic [Candidatus Roizmanbacteria bacterium GW2011_GWA2_35_19]
MPYLENQLKQRIDDKLKILQSLRPLPPSSVEKLKQQFSVEMTYNSNAIEGNRLTLKETFLVIQEGLTIKGKSLKDHLEAKDHFEALNYLYELVEKDKRQTLSEVLIRSIQSLVVRETEKENVGQYRYGNVIITGANHTPPNAIQIPRLMRNFILWVKDNQKKIHPIELAAMIHHRLVYIHPFFDGNGRTARLIMNLFLIQKGYPLVMILKNDRKRYYESLDKADKGDYIPLIRFVGQAVERSLNIYLKTLLPKTKNMEAYYPLSIVSKKFSYSKKYLNLLARTGKLEAHKEKRNWVTSPEAVDRYIKNRLRKRNI